MNTELEHLKTKPRPSSYNRVTAGLLCGLALFGAALGTITPWAIYLVGTAMLGIAVQFGISKAARFFVLGLLALVSRAAFLLGFIVAAVAGVIIGIAVLAIVSLILSIQGRQAAQPADVAAVSITEPIVAAPPESPIVSTRCSGWSQTR